MFPSEGQAAPGLRVRPRHRAEFKGSIMSRESAPRRWAQGSRPAACPAFATPVMTVLLMLGLHGMVATPPAAASTDPTVTDVLGDQLPGRETIQSLKRTLSVPSAATRWRGLPPFGRDLFRGADQRFSPIEDGPVGPDYVLGPGDNLS